MEKTLKIYDKTIKSYLKQFGDGSLDRVVMPVYNPNEDNSLVEEFIQELQRSMKNNKPIENIPEKEWRQLVF